MGQLFLWLDKKKKLKAIYYILCLESWQKNTHKKNEKNDQTKEKLQMKL